MTATLAPTAAPAYAVLMWMDDRNIYAELPSPNGPVVISFSITAGGLNKALDLLRGRHRVEGHDEHYTRPLNPFVKPATALAADEDAIVRNILKRQGMLK